MFLGLSLFLICLSLWLNCCSTFVYYLLIETKYFCYLCFHSNYLCWPKKEKNPSQWSGDDITILPTWQMMIMIARSVMMIGCNGWPAFGFAKGEPAAAGSNSNIGNFHTPTSTFSLLHILHVWTIIAVFISLLLN